MALLRLLISLTALAAQAVPLPAWGQTQVSGRFSGAALEPGWTLQGTAALTAPATDPEGSGWLRLTGNTLQARGTALQSSGGFSAAGGLTLAFSYAAWGGGAPGADGISVFLFDASRNMAGAMPGGGLGYCKGAGGWLALALDEFGNFSHPDDGCSGGGGPGQKPHAIILRGPLSAGNPFVGGVSMPVPLDASTATRRPPSTEVTLQLVPRAAGGFRVTVDWRREPARGWTRLIDGADFPFEAPAALRVGVAASTGALRNIHEVRLLSVVPHVPFAMTQRFEPATVPAGAISRLTLAFGDAGSRTVQLAQDFNLRLPPGLRIADAPELGGNCAGGLTAQPGGDTLRIERGAQLRAGGCTVSVHVVAPAAGRYTSTVPAGSVPIDAGANAAATATLEVRPR